MVDWSGYKACRAEGANAFQRWKCSMPFAPFGPVRFSEKIQRFTPFSLGFEFLPGETYYYISVPTPESSGQCLRLQVSVCCKESSKWEGGRGHRHPLASLRPGEQGGAGRHQSIGLREDFEGESPRVPKLEKSISGTSPKREHLPLAVGIAFFLMTLLAS
ncbi:Ephrin-A3 [Fukomys damarensis]|uniref:Ephrin-A3 n=1 Tax=Fukomys damarensis TaxID=885580 RepID=A0A091DQ21_FUKDA|nr:Ephrin-A3 [Fukomys damarensis]